MVQLWRVVRTPHQVQDWGAAVAVGMLTCCLTMLHVHVAVPLAQAGEGEAGGAGGGGGGGEGGGAEVLSAFSLLWTMYCPAALSLTLLVRLVLADPGVLPRRSRALPAGLPDAALFDASCGEYRLSVLDEERGFVSINGRDGVTLIYCSTCHQYRPPRSSHCRRSNACIARFDHYCDFLGCAIGAGNMRTFLLYIHLLAAMLLVGCRRGFQAVMAAVGNRAFSVRAFTRILKLHGYHFGLSIAHWVLCGVIFIPIALLISYYWQLLDLGLTTREDIPSGREAGFCPPFPTRARMRRCYESLTFGSFRRQRKID